jgi:hypothetical protein
MVPINPDTGKTDRRALSETEIMDFRIKMMEEARSEVRRGKQRARDSPDAGESEGSGPTPSPLARLGELTLESGGSSAADTPADSPSILPQPALPERPAPAPPSSSKTRDTSGKSSPKPPAAAPTQLLTGVTVEVPRTSQMLDPTLRQASRSRSDPSPTSDDGNNASRIAVLERRQDQLENRLQELDSRLKSLGG